MMTGVECDREAWPDIPTPGKRDGELWVANPEVVSGPRGGTEEEEEHADCKTEKRGIKVLGLLWELPPWSGLGFSQLLNTINCFLTASRPFKEELHGCRAKSAQKGVISLECASPLFQI